MIQLGGSMASLTGQNITETYKDLLTISGNVRNQGLEPSLKQIFDGDGIGSPLWLGTNSLEITGSLSITGTLNFQNKSSQPSTPNQGDIIFYNEELYIAKNG